MANFAAGGFAGRPGYLHARDKLAAMRIVVALGARKIPEVVRGRKTAARGLSRLVTLPARNGDMTPGQGKAGPLVLRKRVSSRSEGMHRVAVLTTVAIGRSRELPLVDVRVAILAGRQLDLVDRVQF